MAPAFGPISSRTAVAIGVAVVLDLLLYPYGFGLENHAIQVPLIHRLHDASLYPGDAFMSTTDGYVTFFWPAVAWLTRWVPLEPTFLVGHVLTLIARYAAIVALTRLCFPKEPWAPNVALWLYLWWQPTIGGESLHWFYWAHTPVAHALGLWAIVLVLRGWCSWGFALAGLIANIHLLQAVYLLWMFVVGLLWEGLRRTRVVLTGSFLWLLLGMPMVYVLVRTSAAPAPADLPELLRAFFPVHFFASSFPPRQWIALTAIAALFAASWIGTLDNAIARRAAHIGMAALVLMGIGLITEIAPSTVLLKLHVYRASAYFISLALCLASGWVAQQWRDRVPSSYRTVFGPVALLMVALIPVQTYIRAEQVLVLTASAAFSGCIILSLAASRWARVAGIGAIVSLILLVSLLHEARLRDRWRYLHGMEAWFEVQRWAEMHTERKARFLTPPYMQGFRVFSRRPVVGEWKDGAAVMWDPHFARYWREWYQAVGGQFDSGYDTPITIRLEAAWKGRSEQEITGIARRYDAAYIVLPREYLRRQEWRGEMVFQNSAYFVFGLPAALGREDPHLTAERARTSADSGRSRAGEPSRRPVPE